jgi:hypothetical protein
MTSVEQSVAWKQAAEVDLLGGNMSECLFVDHKYHMTFEASNPPCRGGKPATTSLNYGMSELYRLIDRHLSTKFSVNFCG